MATVLAEILPRNIRLFYCLQLFSNIYFASDSLRMIMQMYLTINFWINFEYG